MPTESWGVHTQVPAHEQVRLRASGVSIAPATRPMRILIDARKLGDGGIGVHVENLISGLLETACDGDEEALALSVIGNRAKLNAYDWSERVRIIEDDAPLYSLDELFRLPRRADTRAHDIYHAPHFTLPFGIGTASIVTIHDLIHVYHPERLYYPLVASPLIRSALARASRIIAVSQSTAEQIKSFLGHDARVLEKLRVMPNTVGAKFWESVGTLHAADQQSSGEHPYFVAVLSNAKPHKGIRDLVKAFTLMHEMRAQTGHAGKGAAAPRLVLVGFGAEEIKSSPHSLRDFHRDVGAYRALTEIVGAVDIQALASWYCRACALVVPSLVEGFCLPALEAHACGTRVVSRPVPALREILGEEDYIAEDMSVPALAQAMLRCVADSNNFDREAFRSRRQALIRSRYCRVKVAQEVRALYRELMCGTSARVVSAEY